MRLLCLFQVMFQYRVGTYEAIAKLPEVDFELWHGRDLPNSKVKNYKGDVSFKHRLIGVRYSLYLGECAANCFTKHSIAA